ncbi:Methionine import ATP-binding protein MetN [Planctomycetes bacterium Pla163]|uniref:Methionine import ATP-binding protein MetN n=1 Tax=Rohdeia mirabilis TaxID=2528008 RepID=A0A518CZT2_9BACT|nr:Methionine import ATP-binding protein MetN [Planctomycetes bacterium Pla163]
MGFLKVEGLTKVYDNGVVALDNVSFTVERGEFLGVIGLSGSGKSTLLRCVNRLVEPSSGRVILDGIDVTALDVPSLRAERRRIGMVFQHFNLVKRKSVLVNVLTGSLARQGTIASVLGSFSAEDRAKAMQCLEIVGLADRARVRASELSGGQQQRVAIARSLMQGPDLLLADEPVASLDPATSHSVMDHLERANKELGQTILCNLHFLSLVRRYTTRVIALKGGELAFEGRPEEIDEDWFKRIYGEQAREVGIE